jgi:hypothetical protein
MKTATIYHTDPLLLHPYIPIHYLIHLVWNDKHGNQTTVFVYIPDINESAYEVKHRFVYDLRSVDEDYINFIHKELRLQMDSEIKSRMLDNANALKDPLAKSETSKLISTFCYEEEEVTEWALALWTAEGLASIADDPKVPGAFGGLAREASRRREEYDESRARLARS